MPPAFIAGGISAVIMFAAYLATAAPDLTFWDASELITAAHTLGIPHPPGTPLWVLLGNVAAKVFAAAGPARAVTLLSVCAGALTAGVGAAMTARWIGTRGAVAAAVSAGAMYSIWANATEAEVYAVSLFMSVVLLAVGEVAGREHIAEDTRARWRALIVFMAALAISVHLSVWVVLPAVVTLAWRGARPTYLDLMIWCALGALGLSAVAILPLLSSAQPALDTGHPVTLHAILDLLQRKQYAVAGLWPRSAPLWLQWGNVFEWADWQVAFGVHPIAPPSFARTFLTVAWMWFAVLGIRTLYRHDKRVGRAMLLLIVCGTIGVATWLNMKAGPSYGVGILPVGAPHEARERDYFFVLGFWGWGLVAGTGLTTLSRSLLRRLPLALAILPLGLAAVPLVLNRSVVDRTRMPLATLPRTVARLLLDAVPLGGVLYTAGDNDTFPLWYLQQVEDFRPDVTVITIPLLGADWYRAQLHERNKLLEQGRASSWPGLDAVLQESVLAATAQQRAVRVSVLVSREDRNRLQPTTGWVLEGMVYAPDGAIAPGAVGLNLRALTQTANQIPPSALMTLAPGSGGAASQMQALLRCAQVRELTDTLLVGTCNRG